MKRRDQKAFTFVEVMVTLSILSVGIVLIFQSFFVCLKYTSHLTHRLHATTMIEHVIASVEKKFRHTHDYTFTDIPLAEKVRIDNQVKVFLYDFDLVPALGMDNLYQLDVRISWEEEGREHFLMRTAYVSTVSKLES